MCLEYVWENEKKEEWLKEQPDMITAYKVVETEEVDGKERLISPYIRDKRKKGDWVRPPCVYKRKNRVRVTKTSKIVKSHYHDTYKKTSYIAYYHLLTRREDAENWTSCNRKVVECLVPKKFITDIGCQRNFLVIITRAFDIVGEDEYFEKKEKV